MARRRDGNVIYVGIKGSVLALDRKTGDEVWQTRLKGSDFVNLVLDGDDLLAATRGEMFCLDARTGNVRWNNRLRGWGWGLVCIATEQKSSDLLWAAEYRRRQEADASAAAASAATG
jgi:outer membrane protein assembly factor BamB